MAPKRKILIVSPSFPPANGGVSDYTFKFAKALHPKWDVHVLTSYSIEEDKVQKTSNMTIYRTVKRWSFLAMLKNVPEIKSISPDVILFQYLPFLYNKRGGINFGIIAFMLYIRFVKMFKVVTMFHELYYPAQANLKAMIMTICHRLMLVGAQLASDIIFCSTENFSRIMKHLFWWKSEVIFQLNVGPNIDYIEQDRSKVDQIKKKYGIPDGSKIISCFGKPHPSKNYQLILNLFSKYCGPQQIFYLVLIGSDEHDLKKNSVTLPNRGNIILTGDVTEQEVNLLLQATQYYIGYFSDGITARRGSLISALQYNMDKMLSTFSPTSDPIFANFPKLILSPTSDSEFELNFQNMLLEISNNQSEETSCCNEKLFNQNFSWSSISTRFNNIISFPKNPY